jgi:glycosyltransferase involved in cell wall biosynthesis
MRITYLHQYFNTPDMSGGTRSYEMARRLVAKGHEVNMVTSWREDDGRRDWFETEEAGIRVHWLPVPYSNNMGFQERIRAFLCFAWGAARKAASLPADVVFATSTPLTIALPGAYAAWRQKAPMVFEVRDLWPELPIAVGALKNPVFRKAAKWLENFAYSRSERIVALSPGMKEGVVKTGFPENKVAVIPNSSDLDLFDPDKADDQAFRREHPEIGGGAPLVVYAGSIGRINGVDYLPYIAAYCKKHGIGVQFAVIAKKSLEEQKVRDTAKRLDVLGKNFHMYPPVPKRKMPEILAAADVALSLFVDLKPMWANSANKFFDALASGTPVAINYGGWQAKLLEETGAGIVLPPDDPDEAARRLDAFVADGRALKEAGHAARRLAEERFSRDQLADQLEQVLLSAAKKDFK